MSSGSTSSIELVPIPTVIGTLVLSVVGLVGNSMVILATIISPTLKHRCNILMCILAISDFVVCIYLIELRIMMLHRWYFQPNSECFLYTVYGLFAMNVQSGTGLMLGVDRLLAVSLPLKYNKLPRILYVAMMAVVLAIAALLILHGYMESSAEPAPICNPASAYNGQSTRTWNGFNHIVSVMVIFVYGAAHVKCRKLNAESIHRETFNKIRHLLHSLSIIMAVSISYWIVIVGITLVKLFPLQIEIINGFASYVGWLVIVNASSNFFIYMWRAPDYRKVFLHILTLGKKKSTNSSDQWLRRTQTRSAPK